MAVIGKRLEKYIGYPSVLGHMSQNWRGYLLQGTQVIFGILASIFLLATIWSSYRALQAGQLGVGANVAPFASATATLFLVVVTAYYARSTRQNVDLASRELNRKIREKHTETLRKRVQLWLGEDYDSRYDPKQLDDRSINLPYVRGADIEPAPAIIRRFGIEEEFRVTPESLVDDPYFQDLLENHAPELRELSDEIKRLQAERQRLQEEFEQKYTDVEAVEALPFPASPGAYFEEWAFERIILLERGIYDKKELGDIAETTVENEATGNEKMTWFPGDSNDIKSVIKCPREADYEKTEVVKAMRTTIDRLEEHEDSYRLGKKAAEVLDEANEKCRKLEMTLVEYRGKLVYSGDCDYIEEASV